MGKQINDLVLLAILQNKIKNAVDENKIDVSKFASVKTIGDASALTQEEKMDISENLYYFLFESKSKSIYVIFKHIAPNDWGYCSLSYSHLFVVDDEGFERIHFRKEYYVFADINGDVYTTEVIIDADEGDYASSEEVTLETRKYPGVTFYANYFTDEPSPIYRFSSGIILDSSSETPHYKIVLASYDVNTAKVTFVEKMLP